MGNRYRCAGSASETYINNERVYDRVDIKSLNMVGTSFRVSTAELNGLLYLSGLPDNINSNQYALYTFDGENYAKITSFAFWFSSICTFNNTIYGIDDNENKLYRLNGTSITFVINFPTESNSFAHEIFVLNNNLYLFSYNRIESDLNRIYRFTGSGWTEIATISGDLSFPTCCLYNGAIHIITGNELAGSAYIHKIFNGTTLTDGALVPGRIQYYNAAYVINNKLRVFRVLDDESGADVYELSGNTWSENTVLNFEGWLNKELVLHEFNAFYYKNEQYLIGIEGSFMTKVTNPIKLGQYFISS